jgi:CRP-like cAMP-binding protein
VKQAPRNHLQGIALFEGLPRAVLDQLQRACRWRAIPVGGQIIWYGASDRDVYLVVSGRVRVTIYSMAGRQVTFRDHVAGDLFGEVAAIDGMLRFGDVVACEPTKLAVLPESALWNLIRAHPIIAARMLRRFAALVRSLSARVIDLSTLAVRNRIHALLLRQAREAGVKGNSARISPAPRHAEIASLVGTYREQVTRELSTLAKHGLLGKERGALVVRDVAKLEHLVHEVTGN